MAVKRNYRINLRNYGNPPAVMVSQYDENYDLVFEVYDGVVPATGLNAYTVKLVGRQPGNDPALKYEFTGTVSGIANNILNFTIDTTMTGRAGKGTAEIVILDTTNDVKFASFNLPVYVEKAAVPDDAIDADVERAQEIADEVQDIVDTAAATVKGEAESWAVGQRDGEDVPSTDPTYHNNAKYYAEQAAAIVESISDVTDQVDENTEDISSLKEDLNGEKAGVIFPTLTSDDFTQGYWSGGEITVTDSRICSKRMYNVNDGDALIIDQGSVQVGAWLYENGDLTTQAINLLAYTDAKPSVYIIPYTGLLLFNAKKASGNIVPSDFTGSIVSYNKNSIDIKQLRQDISFDERPVEYAVSSTYPLGYRNGYFSPTNGRSDATSTYSRTIAPLNVSAGDAVTVTPADGYYVSVVAFSDSPVYTDEGDNSGIFLWSSSGHYTPYTFIAKEGELYFLHTKVPASQRTEANLPTVAKSSQIIGTINQLESEVADLKKSSVVAGTAELYLGEMAQAYMTENGIVEHTTRICMKNALALPHGDRTKLKFSMSEGYKCVIRTGATPYNLNNNGYWYADGSEFTVPTGDKHYRIAIAKTNHESDIALDEFESINLHIYYADDKTDFSAFDSAANAVMLYGPNGSGNMIYRSLPTFVHTSDVHGDYTRVKRFNEYAERLGVTMACITGDMVGYNINTDSNHFEWLHEIIKGSKVKYGICVGNHDSHVGQGSGSYTMADADLYPLFYDPIKTELGHTTEKLWYCTDLTAEKIRIISLDLYQAGGVWTYTYFSQEQLEWLCDTLADTPTGYGVIILMHAQQLSVIKDDDHAKFYQAKRKGEPPENYNAVDNDADPIGDIVDAFIRKTTISASYTQNSGAETLTVSGDFTAVDSSTEFICYMTGHFHQDTIGYNSVLEGEGDDKINVLREPKQLILNVTCGCAVYGNGNYKYLADCSDIPRNNCDATQDAFNVYGIDRLHKTVRVARVGSNLNWALEPRDYMIIPYT